MKTTPLTLADRAAKLLSEPAGQIASGLDARAHGAAPPHRSLALDQVSPFVGLDLQLAATAKPSDASVSHNHFRAAILSLQGAEATLAALASKMNASPPIPLTASDLRSLGPKMRAAAEAVEAVAIDGKHQHDATALYQAVGGFLGGVADHAEGFGAGLGHKAELAKLKNPEGWTKRAMEFWQQVTAGDPKLAKDLDESLALFYDSAERVLKASSKLLRSADQTSALMQPVAISFAERGLWIDAAWDPKTFALELSVGGEPIASTWCNGAQIGQLLYEVELPSFRRGLDEQVLRARLLNEQVNRNGAEGAALEKAFGKRFSSQAAIDKTAKAARTTFAPIEVTLEPEQGRSSSPGPLTVVWDPLWAVMRIDDYDMELRHPSAKDTWMPLPTGFSPEEVLGALSAALAERSGDTSPKALERARVACGIAPPT